MTDPARGQDDRASSTAPGHGQETGRLTARPEFLRVAGGPRAAMPGFVLQAIDRKDADQVIRTGFTCSKKVGNAVTRNRAKRRLREIARRTIPSRGRPGWDYVLVGRRDTTASLPFERLCSDLVRALDKVHGDAG